MKKQSALLLMIFCFSIFSFGQIFKEHHTITTGSIPGSTVSIEIADINNDGDLDILTCPMTGEQIYFLENKGNQEFEILQDLEFFDYIDLSEVKCGDMDNDGLLDIVYSRYDYFIQLRWLKNLGDNNFEHGGSIFYETSGNQTVSFSVHDFNGDNCDDVVVGRNYLDSTFVVRINNGVGNFFNSTISLLDEGELVTYQCIDFDEDDDIDIIYCSNNPYRLVILLNNGEAEFTEEEVFVTNSQNAIYRFHSFDTDNDNDLDIMCFTENDSIILLLNNGDFIFENLSISNDSLFSPWNISSFDFDNDEDLDLMNSFFEIFENVGNNTFRYKSLEGSSPFPSTYKVCDLNKNGDEDIVFSFRSRAIGYIEDFSEDNSSDWRVLTSQVLRPVSPAYKNINSDEYPDICVYDDQYKYVVYLNNGDAEFTDTIAIDRLHVYSSGNPFHDINHDGLCDIISYSDEEYSNFSDGSHFKIAKNNGNNTFTTVSIDEYNHFESNYIVFTDYNNDTKLNAILTNFHTHSKSDSIFFLDVNEDFTIGDHDTIGLGSPVSIRDIEFFDMDKNGQNDIIINIEDALILGYSSNNRFSNDFDTIFQSPVEINDFVVANINSDTTCDIILTSGENIIILENFNGTSFYQSDSIRINYISGRLLANDINNDNLDEIFYITEDTICILKILGHANYSIEKYYYKNLPVYFDRTDPIIFPDIDMDGDDDMLCTYNYQADLSWFENSFIDTLDYSSFPLDNAVWTEQNGIFEGNPPQTWTSLFVTESDTVIRDITYINIYEYYLNPNTFDTIRELYASVRQNVLDKKVYIIRHYLNETSEKLLLDFNAKAGDTIVLDAYYWNLDPLTTDSIFTVDSINTTILNNGEERDLFYLNNHKEHSPVALTLIEGVGSVHNPLGPVTRLVNKELGSGELCCPDFLLCLSVNDELVYVLNDESDCGELEVWSSIQSNDQKALFEIFPNPAKDRLNIKFTEKPSSEYEITVFNNLGTKMYHSFFGENTSMHTIDTKEFSKGVYYVKFSNNLRDYSSKFIIMK